MCPYNSGYGVSSRRTSAVMIRCLFGSAFLLIMAIPGFAGSSWTAFGGDPQRTFSTTSSVSLPLEIDWVIRPFDTAVNWPVANNDLVLVSLRNEMVAFDLSSGSEVWRTTFGDLFTNLDLPVISELHDIAVVQVTGFGADRLAFVDLDDGREYSRTLYASQDQRYLGAALTDSAAYFPCERFSSTCGVRLPFGQPLFDFRFSQVTRWAPSIASDQVITYLFGVLCSRDQLTGVVTWCFDTSETFIDATSEARNQNVPQALSTRPNSAPAVIEEENIIVGFLPSHISVFTTEPRLLWQRQGIYTSTCLNGVGLQPAVSTDYVYAIDSQKIVKLHLQSGDQVWEKTIEGHDICNNPVLTPDHLLVSSTDRLFALDNETGNVLWDFPVGGMIIVSHGKVILATYSGFVFCLSSQPTSADEGADGTLSESFNLGQNYPNPFNPETRIEFAINKRSSVKLTIYNSLGQRVKILMDRYYPAGNHEVFWDGTDGAGQTVASGVYLYRLTTDDGSETKKMLLIR